MLYILKLSYVPSHSNGNLMTLLLLQPLKWVRPPPPPLSLTTGLGGGAGVLFGSHCQCRPLQAMLSPFSRKMPSLEFHVMPASFLDSAPSCPLQDVAPAFLSHSHISSLSTGSSRSAYTMLLISILKKDSSLYPNFVPFFSLKTP